TSPGHARAARAPGAHPRADARVGTGAADRADEPRSLPHQPGLALPRFAADEAQGLDRLGVADDGEQSPGALLLAHVGWRASAGAGAGTVGAGVSRGGLGAGVGGVKVLTRLRVRAGEHTSELQSRE